MATGKNQFGNPTKYGRPHIWQGQKPNAVYF